MCVCVCVCVVCVCAWRWGGGGFVRVRASLENQFYIVSSIGREGCVKCYEARLTHLRSTWRWWAGTRNA